MAETRDVVERLREACVGKPAKVAWPHRLLHDAIAEIERLRKAGEEQNALLAGQLAATASRAERAGAALKRLYDEQLWSKSQETYDAAMKQAESALAAHTEGEG